MNKARKSPRKRKINISRLTRISFLPSVFTMFNLFLGYIALMMVTRGEFLNACYYLIFATVVDSLDGTIARLTKTESGFGVQLDSLSDAISFGLVPSVFLYMWAFKGEIPVSGTIVSFVFLSAGIIRLARFNVYSEAKAFPANIFIGLPIPIASLSVVSSYFLLRGHLTSRRIIYYLSAFVIVLAFLMVSNLQYRTVKKFNSRFNLLILFITGILIALTIMYRFIMIPILCGLYLVSPLIFLAGRKFKKTPVPEEE